jgi:4-hydroxy-tetrahydrodipicolinate synthase
VTNKTNPPFGRLITAMVTPFDDQLKVDWKAVDRVVDHLVSNGTESIVVSGTTGESPTLDDDEKRDLLTRILKFSNGRAKVIMGTGSNSTAKSIKASKEAEKLGADGILVVAPYYNKPSQLGIKRHFEEIAAATKLPIFIYNIPGRTGVNITNETLLQLSSACKNIHALKDSTNSLDQSSDLIGKVRSSFLLYSGDDYLTFPFLSIGGVGIVSVASHIIGNEISQMIDYFLQGDRTKAEELHHAYLPIFKGLFAAPNPTCVKYALSKLGICKEHLRLPLVSLTSREKEAMDKLLQGIHSTGQQRVQLKRA